ncbi:MAG: sensor histidine kinase, partial [bacterium]|nr:sensor histidine kinase [Candidatus Kapabacteria bacterium]
MRLADFIEGNTEAIQAEWVEFAATCGPAARSMDLPDLKDHALEMLRDIVADLRTPQTDVEQDEKAKGRSEPGADVPDTAAEVHGAGRALSGFSQQ